MIENMVDVLSKSKFFSRQNLNIVSVRNGTTPQGNFRHPNGKRIYTHKYQRQHTRQQCFVRHLQMPRAAHLRPVHRLQRWWRNFGKTYRSVWKKNSKSTSFLLSTSASFGSVMSHDGGRLNQRKMCCKTPKQVHYEGHKALVTLSPSRLTMKVHNTNGLNTFQKDLANMHELLNSPSRSGW